MTVNPIREAIAHYIIHRLNVDDSLKCALSTLASIQSVVYDDRSFWQICDAWFNQLGIDRDEARAEIDKLGRQIVSDLSCPGRPAEKLAISLFPVFGYFMTREEMPDLYRCWKL